MAEYPSGNDTIITSTRKHTKGKVKVGGAAAPAITVDETNSNALLGTPSPSAGATSGFAMIPAMASTPTGVPTAETGYSPIVYCTADQKIHVYDYNAAAWVKTAALT